MAARREIGVRIAFAGAAGTYTRPVERPFGRIALALCAALLAASCGNQGGDETTVVAPLSEGPAAGRVEVHTFHSPALDRTMPYEIYLPPGYDTAPAHRYPTLYLLHGLGGTDEQWLQLGIETEADKLIHSSAIAPLVIVMPEGEDAYWVDQAGGGPQWGAYVATDLVKHIDATYRVIRDERSRAIGGLSMGAHGALQLTLNYPHVFDTVGSHSLVLRRFGSAPAYFGSPSEFAQRDPMVLVRTKTALARSLTLWIDIGSDDVWEPLAMQFHTELDGLGIAHQWHLWPGDHSATYWTAHLDDYLGFYDAALSATAGRH
jgi:S-formylglutathione hydrolase FrmB